MKLPQTGGCQCGKIRYEITVCPECGSWICGLPRDGVVRVRGGTLDDTSGLRPTLHLWTRRKQPWVVLPEGDEVFEGQWA